ncbi:MAG TPA: hypothetical protein VHP13_11955 [Gammaproteobacteria bacterium]|jgi:hypothetical protein|nr:hypothetical protein [Gammaproteobacteria bacterium]
MDKPGPRHIAIASTLLWLAGALLLLLAVSLIFYVTSPGAAPGLASVPLGLALWAAAFCTGGFMLRGRRWGYRGWTAVLFLSAVGALCLFMTPMTLIILLLSGAALTLVLLDWHRAPRSPGNTPA